MFRRGKNKVSKKESEFDRYERMKKLEREAEMEKRKSEGLKKKGGRPKAISPSNGGKNWTKNYEQLLEDYDYDLI